MDKQKDMAQYALEYALRKGCRQARALFSSGQENELEVRDGKIDRLHHSGGCQLSLSLFVDGSYSTISTNRLERDELEQFIDKGIISTRFLSADPYRMLPDEDMYYRGEMNDFGLYDDGFELVSVDEKIAVAKGIFEEMSDERIISAAASVTDNETYNYLIDSNGFEGEKYRSLFGVSAQVCVSGEGDERPEDYSFATASHWSKLKRVGVGKECLQRVVDKIGAERMSSGAYNVIVDRRVASRLFSPLFSALKGEALDMKASFLLDKKGVKIASDRLNVVDNPRQYGKLGARLFDREGIAMDKMPVIENGVLMNYFISQYMSKKMKVRMTHGSSAVLDFGLGEEDTAGLIRRLGTGIYITDFNGGNCNGTTGDFSFGIEGYYVENGVIVRPISEMLMTGNMLTLWGNLVDMSNDPLYYSAWNIPSLMFEGVVVN